MVMNARKRVFIILSDCIKPYNLRSLGNKREVNRIVFMAARSSNGRTTDSGSVYLGSNPSLAAMNGIDFSFITFAH